jgi:hypothetical protein
MPGLVQSCCGSAFLTLAFSTCRIDISCQAAISLLILLIISTSPILHLCSFECYCSIRESASDFWSLVYMSSPSQILQGSSPPESSLLPWPENPKLRHAVLPNDWERYPHPQELEYLPDGPQTPYELRQIVKRSMYKHESESESSKFPQIKPKIQTPEAPSAPALRPLPKVHERQHRDSLASADSWETCSGGSEVPSTATVDTTLVPSPLNIPCPKPRELKPKSSFLASKIGRLGAKIEKLELTPSRRSSRNIEQQTSVATGYVLFKTRNE